MPEESFDELVESYRKDLELDAKDEDLSAAIDMAIQESKDVKDLIDKIGKRNKKFWAKGSDEDFTKFHPKKSQVVTNRIFADIETSIPILTARTPEPTIINAPDNAIKEKLHKALNVAYEVKYKFQQLLQKVIRDWYINRIGILKYRWDEEKGFVTKKILPKRIGFDKTATSMDDVGYVWEIIEITVEKLIKLVPKKEKEILEANGAKDDKALKSKINYVEFWGDNGKWYVWKLDKLILKKKRNPNFDYGEEAQGAVEATEAIKGENNIFANPRPPYLILTVFALEDDMSVYDDTSLIEATIPLQIDANTTKRQISDLNEGQKRVWVGSGEFISDKVFTQLINKTGDVGVYLDKGTPLTALTQVQSGKPDASLYNNLQDSLNQIDNVIGMHSTTRGERGQTETLGGRKLLVGADTGRQDLIVRNVEQLIEEWYLAYLHMTKVFEDETIELDDGENKIQLDPKQIPNNIVIQVKKGTTLPIDDATKFEQAFELAKAQLIDPSTLYQEMGYPDPEGRFQKLLPWLQLLGVIQPQQQQGAGGGQGEPQGTEEDANAQLKQEQLKQLCAMVKVIQALPEGNEDLQKQLINQAREIAQGIQQ